jgi:hypothetical protein
MPIKEVPRVVKKCRRKTIDLGQVATLVRLGLRPGAAGDSTAPGSWRVLKSVAETL